MTAQRFGRPPPRGNPDHASADREPLALAALAMYGGAALGLEDAHQRAVLPLFRRGAAAESFEGWTRSSTGSRPRRAFGSSFDARRPRVGAASLRVDRCQCELAGPLQLRPWFAPAIAVCWPVTQL